MTLQLWDRSTKVDAIGSTKLALKKPQHKDQIHSVNCMHQEPANAQH